MPIFFFFSAVPTPSRYPHQASSRGQFCRPKMHIIQLGSLVVALWQRWVVCWRVAQRVRKRCTKSRIVYEWSLSRSVEAFSTAAYWLFFFTPLATFICKLKTKWILISLEWADVAAFKNVKVNKKCHLKWSPLLPDFFANFKRSYWIWWIRHLSLSWHFVYPSWTYLAAILGVQ